MPKTYAPDVKASFISAAQAARQAGHGWDGALKAAREAGYKGGVGGLKLWVYSKGKRGKTAAGKQVASDRAAVAGKTPAGGLAQIEAIVAQEVQKRLKVAKDAAVKAFEEPLGV